MNVPDIDPQNTRGTVAAPPRRWTQNTTLIRALLGSLVVLLATTAAHADSLWKNASKVRVETFLGVYRLSPAEFTELYQAQGQRVPGTLQPNGLFVDREGGYSLPFHALCEAVNRDSLSERQLGALAADNATRQHGIFCEVAWYLSVKADFFPSRKPAIDFDADPVFARTDRRVFPVLMGLGLGK